MKVNRRRKLFFFSKCLSFFQLAWGVIITCAVTTVGQKNGIVNIGGPEKNAK